MKVPPIARPLQWAPQFLQAIVSRDPDPLDHWLAVHRLDETRCQWLQMEGLAPFVFYHLRRHQLLDRLPTEPRAAFCSAFYATAAQGMMYQVELRSLIERLRPLDIELIIVKGIALGITAYPTPATRPVGDLDVLIRARDIDAVKQLVIKHGYRDDGLRTEERPALNCEMTFWRELPGGQRLLVEFHWHLFPAPGYLRLDLSGLFARSIPLDLDGFTSRVLDPIDQLIYSCGHLMIKHYYSWIMLWLLDLRMIVDRFGAQWDWQEVIERAQQMRLAGSLRHWLNVTEIWFGSCLSQPAQTALANIEPTRQEEQYARLAHTATHRVWTLAWEHMRHMERRRLRLAFVKQLFFPPWSYMQYRYKARSRWLAPVYYGWRMIRAILIAFRHVHEIEP